MKRDWRRQPFYRATGILAGAGALALAAATPVSAQDATAILRAMTQYVGSQRTIALTFDTEIEIITPQLQKLQFDSSGEVSISRPDKFHARRTGGYADVELFADGKTFTLLGRDLNAFVQAEAKGTGDEIVDRLRDQYGAEIPGADLLRSDAFATLTEGVIDTRHIGRGVVDGVECEHLAFRTQEVDWQLWVEVGERPIPRKYVITSKTVAAAPQYTVRIRNWKTGAAFAADRFAFKAPDGARKVDIEALRDLGEIPPGAAIR